MPQEKSSLTKGFTVTNLSDREKSDLVAKLQGSRFSSKKSLTTAEASIVTGIRGDKLREFGRMGKIGTQDKTGKWNFSRIELMKFSKSYKTGGGKNKPVRMLMNVPREKVGQLVKVLMDAGLYNLVNLNYYNVQKNMPSLSTFEKK